MKTLKEEREAITDKLSTICKQADQYQINAGYPVETPAIKIVEALLLSHEEKVRDERDTYWKERVRKEVRDAYEHAEIVRQRTLNEIRQAVEDDEPYGGAKECIYAILDRYQPDVEIVQNQETGEIITANGVPLTPTSITNEDNLK